MSQHSARPPSTAAPSPGPRTRPEPGRGCPPRRPGGEILYNGIRLPARGRRGGRISGADARPYLDAAGGHPDRRRPATLRRRLPDRRDDAHAHVSPAEVPRRQPVLRPDQPWEHGRAARGDGLQRRRLVRPAGSALQDVVHGRPRPGDLLRHLEGRHALGEADARRRQAGHQHRPARTARDSVHGLARPRGDGPEAAVQDVPRPGATRPGRRCGQSVHFSRRRHPLERAGRRDRLVRRPQHRLLQPVPQGLGLQPPHARLELGRDAAATGRRRRARPAPQWKASTSRCSWVGADRLDPRRDDYKVPPQLYNLDCVAYESLLLGLFTIWRRPAARTGRSRTRSASATAATASTGPARPPRLLPGLGDARATGTGATCSRPAAAAWSSATSCTSTSAAGPA